MRDSVGFSTSFEGEADFKRAVRLAETWIKDTVAGAVKLKGSVSLKLVAAEDGELVSDMLANETITLGENGKPGWLCRACKSRHHENCTGGDCTCPKPVHHPEQDNVNAQ